MDMLCDECTLHAKGAQILYDRPDVSLEECLSICKNHTQCWSVQYQAGDGMHECHLILELETRYYESSETYESFYLKTCASNFDLF